MQLKVESKTSAEGLIPVRERLAGTDISQFVSEFISRKDGLHHLLYSDVVTLLNSIANDFPEVATVHIIGQSSEGRDIPVI